MSLRARLTLAFFAISVVPLTAVTLYSYYTSRTALHRAAEQQARSLAAELGQRMDWVTHDLEKRMDKLWAAPETEALWARHSRPDPGSSPDESHQGQPVERWAPSPALAGELVIALGDMAPMLETLQIEPEAPPGRTPPAPPPPRPPKPGVPSAVPPVPTSMSVTARVGDNMIAVDGAGRLTIEVPKVIASAMAKYRAAGESEAGQAAFAEWAKDLGEQIRRGAADIEQTLEAARRNEQAAAASGGAVRRKAAAYQVKTVFKGHDVTSSVQEDGQQVASVKARVNAKRMLGAVLANTRRHQGEIPFAIDAEGQLHAPAGGDRQIEALGVTAEAPTEGTLVRTRGGWVLATHKDRTGVTVGIARPISNDLRDLQRAAALNFGVGFGLIALVFAGSVPLASGMTRHLRTLMAGAHRIARGDLSTRIPVRSSDEFGRLAAAFNQMAADLATHQALLVGQERLHRELELCRQIQTGILPGGPLRLGVTEVRGVSIPAREVGGDFFNYFALPSGDIALLVGDVSGKGVGAALLMANVQATLRARLPLEQDLPALADALDRDLEAHTPPEVFLTLFVAILDPREGTLRYVNAGHNTQFVLHAHGLERMAATGMPLGLFAGHGYQERRVHLSADDLLFFYTDGMVETENEAGGVWGVERLESLLLSGGSRDLDTLLARIEDDVRTFRGKAEPLDDATMMALRFGGQRAADA
ncbi:MAG TPA: SpoIIE family protein phosphatase [Vicinamibacterales bacterium]|nr:SpoIIE family protein phosphatase [Vicinamibacterales bacterium]